MRASLKVVVDGAELAVLRPLDAAAVLTTRGAAQGKLGRLHEVRVRWMEPV